MKRWIIIGVGLLMCACGGSSTPPTPQAFHQTLTGTLDAGKGTLEPITIARSGNMTVSLTWPDEDVSLLLFLASQTCEPANCRILEAGADSGVHSQRVTHTVRSGEVYQIVVNNILSSARVHYTVDIDIE